MYESNGKLVWMSYDNIGALEELKTKYGLKSPNQVLPILLDLEQGLNGSYELAKKQKCQSCGTSFDIPENTSGVYKLKSIIRHSDLEKTDCRGMCRNVSGVRIKTKVLPGATEQSDTLPGIIEAKVNGVTYRTIKTERMKKEKTFTMKDGMILYSYDEDDTQESMEKTHQEDLEKLRKVQ